MLLIAAQYVARFGLVGATINFLLEGYTELLALAGGMILVGLLMITLFMTDAVERVLSEEAQEEEDDG